MHFQSVIRVRVGIQLIGGRIISFGRSWNVGIIEVALRILIISARGQDGGQRK